MATSLRQGTLSLSWPPTLSPFVPPSTGLHTLLVGSIFSKRIFDIQYREKGVFFFPLLFPVSELTPPENIQCSIYIQVLPGPNAEQHRLFALSRDGWLLQTDETDVCSTITFVTKDGDADALSYTTKRTLIFSKRKLRGFLQKVVKSKKKIRK